MQDHDRSAAQFRLRIGTLQEEGWVEFHASIRLRLENEGVEAWKKRIGKKRFGQKFAAFIDREIAGMTAA